MAVPTHVLGVDLLNLILRSKDPFPPKFFCHSCKEKFTIPMKSTAPRPTSCTLCSSKFIEWVLPEDPHQRAARLRDAAMFPHSPSPSPPPSPPPPTSSATKKPPEQQDEPMDTDPTPTAATDETKSATNGTASSASATGGDGATPSTEPMEQESAKEEAPDSDDEEDSRSGGRLSAQPMVVISAGGDPANPTLSMNLFPSLDEAGPRSEGRKGPIRTIIVQQQTSRNFTYLAQEYMAQIIEGGRGQAGRTRRGQQLLVGLTGGAQNANSDPADFVWGARGLDSIISGLLDSMADRGPPPAKKDKVDAIPVVEATQDIVNTCVDGCTVCKDAFKVGDKLRKLPCKHLFHETCIIPWLKLHDTCPTCRYHVNTEKEKESAQEDT